MHSNKFYQVLNRLASPTKLLLWFLSAHLVLLCMMIFTFPKINARLGTEAFDLRPLGYTVPEAMQILQELDPATVQLYLFPQLFLFDVLYPMLLALFLSTLMVRLANLTEKQNTLLVRIGITLPFFAMIFDYSENLLIAQMITDPVHVSSGLIKTSSAFTLLKGIFTASSWVVTGTLAWFRLKGYLRKRSSGAL